MRKRRELHCLRHLKLWKFTIRMHNISLNHAIFRLRGEEIFNLLGFSFSSFMRPCGIV